MESISPEEVLFTPTHGGASNGAGVAFSRLRPEAFPHRSDVFVGGALNSK
jgi:hypothetical protein